MSTYIRDVLQAVIYWMAAFSLIRRRKATGKYMALLFLILVFCVHLCQLLVVPFELLLVSSAIIIADGIWLDDKEKFLSLLGFLIFTVLENLIVSGCEWVCSIITIQNGFGKAMGLCLVALLIMVVRYAVKEKIEYVDTSDTENVFLLCGHLKSWIIIMALGTTSVQILSTSTPLYFVFSVLETSCLYLSITALYYQYQMQKTNEGLALSVLQAEQELEQMHHLQEDLDQLKGFRHDYHNLLLSLHYSVEQNNIEEIKRSIENLLEPLDVRINDSQFLLNQFERINCTEVRGILLMKYFQAIQNGLAFELIVDAVQGIEIPIAVQDLVRILGIWLDNAMEEAIYTEEKKVIVHYADKESSLEVSVVNTCRKKTGNPLVQEDFGTSEKPGHEGRGLRNVRQILKKYDNIFVQTTCSNHMLRQVMIVERCDQGEQETGS